MKILFDQGTPRPLRRFLTGHEVRTSAQMGWSKLDNGDLLKTAEGNFDAFITTDKNLCYQQKLQGRRLAILVLPTPDWNIVKLHGDQVLAAVNGLRAGEYRELTW
jgi:hypothetical protein